MFKNGKEYMDEELSFLTVPFEPENCPYRIWVFSPLNNEQNAFIYISTTKTKDEFTEILRLNIKTFELSKKVKFSNFDFEKIKKFVNIYKKEILDCWNHKRSTGSLISIDCIEWDKL